MEYIEEHKPLVLIENLFVIGYLVIMLIPLIFTKVKIKLSDLAMMGGLLFMSFLSIRHIALLGIIGMFYLCRLICNIGRIKGNNPLDYNLPGYGIAIVTLTIVGTSVFVYNINYKEAFINEQIYPVSMVYYMEQNLDMDKVRLYNEYDFGSYLIYHDIPVFIDSRADLYAPEFNGTKNESKKYEGNDIFEDFIGINNLSKNYETKFSEYKITHVITCDGSKLSCLLDKDSDYLLIYSDEYFRIYERERAYE